MAESGSEKEGVDLGEIGDETLKNNGILDGTLREYHCNKRRKLEHLILTLIKMTPNTFENFSKYNGSELADKLDNAETKQLDNTKRKQIICRSYAIIANQ
ncbi:hypothetical protein ACO1DJ_12195 [Staphylococcus epidermidis]|uniref:hypothetical protein n=1 Tax=Staphylococcus epidermidis TaxID=1282 RepID=UPI003BF65BAA